LDLKRAKAVGFSTGIGHGVVLTQGNVVLYTVVCRLMVRPVHRN
jgi:hypothetical protein